ncbi:slipin family protein [Geosporobacter ferrireducens]|uniref:slipin family protein n=1 Tax=Geosporobacter ferrireducens TaxID=1424294 RepID=UPI00139ACD30|nr:slipin family protein [Geosporobacter ferrireducens]MTI56528.1 slipin family protein [Geosporobacter ferrireducens]
MKYIVNTHEVGLLFENNSFIKALPSKTYYMMPFTKKWILSVDMAGKFEVGHELSLFLDDDFLANKLDVINLKDNEIALHYVDGNFCDILAYGSHAYFNTIKKHTFVVIDTNSPFLPDRVDLNIFGREYFRKEGFKYIHSYSVPAGKIGILTVNGTFLKILSSGSHYFVRGINTVEVRIVDGRKQLLEISGQELLSEDKVTLRMNYICQYKIVDPVKITMEFDDFEQQLYITMQLALREYVATRKLDELLAQKHEIGSIILNSVRHKQDEFGIALIEAGVKDIILPGDIKEILNTVLIAEKKAFANVITRREETASTRSLLNTARLMEENKTLYKLKELEYLERICDKVGSISLSANAGILEQLSQLVAQEK